MDLDMAISANSVQMLARVATEHDVDPSRLLTRAGVAGEVLTDPRAEVTIRQEYAVMRALLAECGHPAAFGVEVGLRYHLAMHGIWGLLMATSRNLREAIGIGLRYLGLAWVFTPMTLEEDGIAILTVDDGQVPADVRAFLIERIAAAARVLVSELLGEEIVLRAVCFRHEAPRIAADLRTYRKAFGCTPEFSADCNALSFDADYLDRALPQGDDWVRRGYEEACAELLNSRCARSGVAGSVRQELTRVPGVFPDVDEVSRALRISSRTLLRRLQQEGTTFRALVDEVRETIAEELLCTAGLTTEQVAYRLGYAEPTSFVRAFKRWKGTTPQSFRRLATV